MEAVSPAGAIGAVVGLILGWLDYKVVGGWVARKLKETDRSETAAEKADYQRRIVLFQRWFLLSTVGAIPIVGYLLGQAVAG
ncbi:MAG TPA: hypothetical protein VFY72_13565 [Beijerinckiaceae bacterium]|nr:hypothetical protein [Beijerinckiaceae bacterium]